MALARFLILLLPQSLNRQALPRVQLGGLGFYISVAANASPLSLAGVIPAAVSSS
jgi:hypothetical protein